MPTDAPCDHRFQGNHHDGVTGYECALCFATGAFNPDTGTIEATSGANGSPKPEPVEVVE
jgi:hypothetical protein